MVTCAMEFHNSLCGGGFGGWVELRAGGSVTICATMKGLPSETDFVVIGAGVAGLRAAIELASAGRVLGAGEEGGHGFEYAARARRSRSGVKR